MQAHKEAEGPASRGGAKAIAVALPPTAHGAPTATSQLAASAGAGEGKLVVGTGGRFGLGVAGKEKLRYYSSCGRFRGRAGATTEIRRCPAFVMGGRYILQLTKSKSDKN